MAPTALEKAVHDRDSTVANIDVLDQEFIDNATVPLTEPEVTHYLAMITALQTEITEINKRIIYCAPADPDVHKQVYLKEFKRTSKLLAAYTGLKMAFPATTAAGHVHIPTTATDIKLRRLELPTFAGNLDEWVSFRDMFMTAVHGNPKLSKAQKFTYLKSQLKGEASRQISSMIISDGNYDVAWSQLQDRYQNDRELLFAIMRKLFNQAAVPPQSAILLRKLIDTSQECIRSLDVLALPTDKWDAILLYLLTTKLDSSSKELWEQSLKDSSIPTLKSFFEFLEQRARALAASGNCTTTGKPITKPNNNSQGNNTNDGAKTRNGVQSRPLAYHANTIQNCKVCDKSQHQMFKCDKFLAMTVQQRNQSSRRLRLCLNCLQEGHRTFQCTSNKSCLQCGRWHHTLLHYPTAVPKSTEVSTPIVHFASSAHPPNEYDTLLATALVKVQDLQGRYHEARVLVDNGSNTHFISGSFAKKLQLPRKRCATSAFGLGGSSVTTATGLTSFSVSPYYDVSISFSVSRCLVTSTITGKLPTSLFDHTRWSHLQNLQLADPKYHQPQDVDILLGAEFFFDILEGKKLTGSPNSPVAFKTSFGWLIGG